MGAPQLGLKWYRLEGGASKSGADPPGRTVTKFTLPCPTFFDRHPALGCGACWGTGPRHREGFLEAGRPCPIHIGGFHMKLSTLAITLAAALASTTTMAAAPSKPAAPAAGRYLVVFKSDTVPSDAAALIGKAGGKLIRSFDQVGVASATGNAGFLGAIAKDTRVLSVGPENRFEAPQVTSKTLAKPGAVPNSLQGAPTPDDFLYYLQWDMRRIGADQVWSRLPVSAAQPRVALLDVGTMDTHPDLVGQIDASKSTAYCSTSGGTNNTDGYPIYSTYIDFSVYPDWTPGTDPCLPLGFDDFEFHGTHTAGTIGAAFGGGAVVGVAPDAQIGVYKVFDLYSPDGVH